MPSTSFIQSSFQHLLSFVGIEKKEIIAQGQKEAFTFEESELFHDIVSKGLDFAKKRFVHPHISPEGGGHPTHCTLTFLQSYSWTKVEKMLKGINSIDNKVQEWVKDWLIRINNFRTQQIIFRDCIDKRNACEKKRLSKDHSSFDEMQLYLLENEYQDDELKAKEHINTFLIEGRFNLSNLDPENENDAACMKVVNYIKENWNFLSAFASCPEIVDVDSHKINVKFEYDEKLPVLNNSTQAVFIIHHKTPPKIEPLPYKGTPCHLYSPTSIGVKEFFLDESSKEESPSILSDADLMNFPEYHIAISEEQQYEIPKNIPALVNLAIQEINTMINSDDFLKKNPDDASDEN